MKTFVALPVAGFAVDSAARTIEGLAMPYGATAHKHGLMFRFAAGSIKWTDVGRIKLLRDHDIAKPVGKALALTDTAEGLRVRFRVARGPAGDEALQLAEDGVLDGLSVGVDFEESDTTVDSDSALLVQRADLREISLTAMPAFDDARLTKVTATKGVGMQPEEPTTTAPAPTSAPVATAAPTSAAPVTFTLEQLVSALRSAAPAAPTPAPDPGPTAVNPTARPLPGQTFTRERPAAPAVHPLAYRPEVLDRLQAALDARSPGRFVADNPDATFATLVTGTLGAGRVWGSNVLAGPRLLHVVANIPRQPADAIFAQFPQLTLPTAQASVGEGVTVTEYATSAAGSLTMGRFGRWTDLSEESQVGADAGAIIGMHQLGIALDMDKVLIDGVETAAGAAVAFTADVPAAIRSAMAKVMAATAAEDPADLTILVHPDNAALLQDVTPTGGATIAEKFQRFSGGLVYPSNAVNTGFITVANLKVGTRYFEVHGARTLTDVNVKTNVETIATSALGGYGITVTTGFAVMVDVVTP
ncbi:HK97 family phage prohead protease [Asanoa iriomotensis]|uniref:HK97 family phage prohead protease n=2 Tax=Asanoa iriomotensis TaxID=234613 RepID=UPI0031DAA24D